MIKISSFKSNNTRENNFTKDNNNSINHGNINKSFISNSNIFQNIPNNNNEEEQLEKSLDSRNNIFNSEIKGLKQLSRISNKDKHNLLKIVNMYMKDEKKAQSRVKVSGLLKSSNKKKKST